MFSVACVLPCGSVPSNKFMSPAKHNLFVSVGANAETIVLEVTEFALLNYLQVVAVTGSPVAVTE